MKKLKLTIKDRLVFPSVLPEKSDMSIMLTRRDILKKMDLSIDEIQKFKVKIVFDGGEKNWNWVDTENSIFEYEFTDSEFFVLTSSVDDLINRKQITDDMLDICKQIKGM